MTSSMVQSKTAPNAIGLDVLDISTHASRALAHAPTRNVWRRSKLRIRAEKRDTYESIQVIVGEIVPW